MEEKMIPVEESVTPEEETVETPVEETVAEEPATEETPVEETAAEEPATEEAPVEETAAEEPATEETPVEDVKKVEISCCKCGAKLKVKIGTEICMCPKCGEIFKVKATLRRVKDVSPKQITKAYVRVSKDEKGKFITKVLQ